MEDQNEPKINEVEIEPNKPQESIGFFQSMFTQFKEIFNPNFLHGALFGDKLKNTWKFWFFVNAIVTFVFVMISTYAFSVGTKTLVAELDKNYSTANISMSQGVLDIEGIENPSIIEDEDNRAIFIIDTKENKYDPTILSDYEEGVLVLSDKIYYKKNNVEAREFSFKEFGDFSFSEKDLTGLISKYKTRAYLIVGAMMFIVGLIYFSGLRLISAVWWAFLLWIAGLIAGVKELNFGKAYLSILNFYAIPTIVVGGLALLGFGLPFFTFFIFLAIFVLNLMQLKKLQKTTLEVTEVEMN